MNGQFLYSVEYHDWNSDFSGFIDRQLLVFGENEEAAIENAKQQARPDSRNFKATRIDTVMGMRIAKISVAQAEKRVRKADIGETWSDAAAGENPRAPVQAYIENAHDDSIGGFTIPLPTTKEALQPWLDAIGAGTFQEADIAIRDVRSSIPGLEFALDGITDAAFDELNYLAAKIQGFETWKMEIFTAAIEAGFHCDDIADLINLTENIAHFDLQPAFSEEQYGAFLIEMEKDNSSAVFERLEQSGDQEEREFAQYVLRLEAHVDEAAYGRDVALEESGVFTSRGYVTDRGKFSEVYRGPEDIPPERRIFAASLPPVAEEKTERPDEPAICSGRADGKNSLIAKIREAKNEPGPAQNPNSRKKHEPEL